MAIMACSRKDATTILTAALRTLGALLILVAVAWALRRYAPTAWKTPPPRAARMRRLETLPLTAKRQLILVQIDQTVIGIGLHEQGMTVVYTAADTPLNTDAAGWEPPTSLVSLASSGSTIREWLHQHASAGEAPNDATP